MKMVTPIWVRGPRVAVPDAVDDWARRVQLNGGAAPSAPTQAALRTFYQGLVNNHLLAKMKAVLPVVPGSLTAALTPLIRGPGLDPWTNHGFVAADLTVDGLKGDGAGKYLDTGVVPSAAFGSIADGGLTVYVTAASNGQESELQSSQGTGQTMALYACYNGSCFWDCYSSDAARLTAGTNGWRGYLSANRGVGLDGGGATQTLYQASSTQAHRELNSTGIIPGGTLPNKSLYAFGGRLAGDAPGQYTAKRLSFLAVHSGLTMAESAIFYGLIQALRQALGGGYV